MASVCHPVGFGLTARRSRPFHRIDVRGRNRMQRSLHSAARATVLARPLRVRSAIIPDRLADLSACSQPADLFGYDRRGYRVCHVHGSQYPGEIWPMTGKRLVDLTVAACGLVVTSPLIVLIAVAVR